LRTFCYYYYYFFFFGFVRLNFPVIHNLARGHAEVYRPSVLASGQGPSHAARGADRGHQLGAYPFSFVSLSFLHSLCGFGSDDQGKEMALVVQCYQESLPLLLERYGSLNELEGLLDEMAEKMRGIEARRDDDGRREKEARERTHSGDKDWLKSKPSFAHALSGIMFCFFSLLIVSMVSISLLLLLSLSPSLLLLFLMLGSFSVAHS
jgi:hypothetical protein